MRIPISQLDDLIEDCKGRLEQAEQQVALLKAELRGYLAAYEAVSATRKPRNRRTIKSSQTRALSENWKRLLRYVGTSDSDGVSIDDLMDLIEIEGLDISRGSVRSQLSIYTGKGILERISDGIYCLTDEGQKLVMGEENGSESLTRQNQESKIAVDGLAESQFTQMRHRDRPSQHLLDEVPDSKDDDIPF